MDDLSRVTCDLCKIVSQSRRAYERHCGTPGHIAAERSRALRQPCSFKRHKTDTRTQSFTQSATTSVDNESSRLPHHLAAVEQQPAGLDSCTAIQHREGNAAAQEESADVDPAPELELPEVIETEQQEPAVDLDPGPARQRQQGAAAHGHAPGEPDSGAHAAHRSPHQGARERAPDAAAAGRGGIAEVFESLRSGDGDLEAAEAAATEQLLRLTQRPTLQHHAAVIAKACLRLPEHLRDEPLRTLATHGSEMSSLPWKSAKELSQDLDSMQEFEDVVVHRERVLPGDANETAFSMKLRKDNATCKPLQDLLLRPQARGMAYKARAVKRDGERIMFDVASGSWMEEKQAQVDDWFEGEEACVLPMLFYSDGSDIPSTGQHFHPLNLYVASFTMDNIRHRDGYCRIAMLPVLSAAVLGLQPGSDRMTQLNRRVLYASFALALQPYKDASYTGLRLFCIDRLQRFFAPLPAATICDLKEAGDAHGIRPYPFERCDVNSLTKVGEMNGEPGPARTEVAMQEVLQKAAALKLNGNPEGASKVLDEHGMSSIRGSPFAGFNFTDCYDLYHPDRLHQWDCGVLHHIMVIIEGRLSTRDLKTLNDYLKALPIYSWYKTPSFGLAVKKKATATERHNLFPLIPVALLAFHESDLVKDIIMVCIALLDFQELRDLPEHTDASLAALDDACLRAQKLCVEKLGHLQKSSFCFPKFLLMRRCSYSIRRLGSLSYCSTGFGERAHGDFNRGKDMTNRHGDVTGQMLNTANRVDAIRSVTRQPVDNGNARSAAQKAVPRGHPVLAGTQCTVCYDSSSPDSLEAMHFVELFKDEPPLGKILIAKLRAMLAADACAHEHGDRSDMLHDASGCKLELTNGLGLSFQKHRGSQPEGLMLYCGRRGSIGRATEPRQDSVCVRGNDQPLWFCRLELLFRCRTQLGRELSCALVRWYTCDGARPVKAAAKALRLERLRWETVRKRGRQVPRYDVISVDSIIGPAYIQPEPGDDGRFYYHNKYVF